MNKSMIIHQLYNCHRWDLKSIQKWWKKKLVEPDLLHLGDVQPTENTAWVENEGRERGRFVGKGLRGRKYCNAVDRAGIIFPVGLKKKKKKHKKNLSLTKHNKLQKNDRVGLVLWHALPWEAWHPLSVLSCRAITLYKYNKDTLDVSPDFWGLLENYTLVLGLNRLFRIRNVRKLSRYAKYSTARRNRRGPEN